MKNKPPDYIYLQCHDEEGNLLDFVRDDVTWCVDQINENDAVYSLTSRCWSPLTRHPKEQQEKPQ